MFVSVCYFVFFFKQKTAYEMRISDWSSDVCSSDLVRRWPGAPGQPVAAAGDAGGAGRPVGGGQHGLWRPRQTLCAGDLRRAFLRGARKSVVSGKSVSVRVYLGGRRILKQKRTISTKQSQT